LPHSKALVLDGVLGDLGSYEIDFTTLKVSYSPHQVACSPTKSNSFQINSMVHGTITLKDTRKKCFPLYQSPPSSRTSGVCLRKYMPCK